MDAGDTVRWKCLTAGSLDLALSKEVHTKDAYVEEIHRTVPDGAMGREHLPRGKLYVEKTVVLHPDSKAMLERYEEWEEKDTQASSHCL